MLLALKRKDFTKGVNGVECGYFDKVKRMAVNLGRVCNGKALTVKDEDGKNVLEQNGGIFREVKSEEEISKEYGAWSKEQKTQPKTPSPEQENDNLAFEEVMELPVKKIRELFLEAVDGDEKLVPPVTVKKGELVKKFLEVYNAPKSE